MLNICPVKMPGAFDQAVYHTVYYATLRLTGVRIGR